MGIKSKIKREIKKRNSLFLSLKKNLLYLRYLTSIHKKGKYSDLNKYPFKKLTEIRDNTSHSFFGYYDKSPISKDDKYLAYLSVPKNACDKDIAKVCIYDIENGVSRVVAETPTWNWQQGCMLQWIDQNTISFNSFDKESNRYYTVWLNTVNNETREFNRAAYSYNSNHTKYLSLNFYRLYNDAKGYGYRFNVDDLIYEKDGIWETDTENGNTSIILTLREIIDFKSDYTNDCIHYVNHICYTPNNENIILIHRWQQPGGEFKSRLLLFNLKNKSLKLLLNNKHVSHYFWKDNDNLLIYATDKNGYKGYILLNINDTQSTIVEGLPNEDGHPSYRPDGDLILTDTYPNRSRKQYLLLYNTNTRELRLLDELYSPFKYYNENRCDLHPRWSYDGKYVIVDNTATGLRSIKIYQIS